MDTLCYRGYYVVKFNVKNGDSVVKGDFTGLNKLVAGLSKKLHVDVGILGGAEPTDDGYTLAGVMAVHEFGSIKKSIPERSWLRMPLETKGKDIEKTVQPKVKELLENGDTKGIFKLIGLACETQIQEAFETGGFGTWDQLSPSTVKGKGSSKILIDTGAARQAVTSKVSE